MGSSKNKNKGRKTSLGGHLKSKSLGKWFMHWHIRKFFGQKSKLHFISAWIDKKSFAGHLYTNFML